MVILAPTLWLCLLLPPICRAQVEIEDLICSFPQEQQPTDILKLLSHHPLIRVNIFYWNLAVLGLNIASLSMPHALALELQNVNLYER